MRAQGAALATITNWLFTFLVVMVTPVAISTIGWKCVGLLALVVVGGGGVRAVEQELSR